MDEIISKIRCSNLDYEFKESLIDEVKVWAQAKKLDKALRKDLRFFIEIKDWKVTYPMRGRHYQQVFLIKDKWLFSVIVGERYPDLGPIWLECDCCHQPFGTINEIIEHLEQKTCSKVDISQDPPKQYSVNNYPGPFLKSGI